MYDTKWPNIKRHENLKPISSEPSSFKSGTRSVPVAITFQNGTQKNHPGSDLIYRYINILIFHGESSGSRAEKVEEHIPSSARSDSWVGTTSAVRELNHTFPFCLKCKATPEVIFLLGMSSARKILQIETKKIRINFAGCVFSQKLFR